MRQKHQDDALRSRFIAISSRIVQLTEQGSNAIVERRIDQRVFQLVEQFGQAAGFLIQRRRGLLERRPKRRQFSNLHLPERR